MRTQLQSLIFEKFGLGCNDLAEGDAGTDGRESDGLRRKGGGAGPGASFGRARHPLLRVAARPDDRAKEVVARVLFDGHNELAPTPLRHLGVLTRTGHG